MTPPATLESLGSGVDGTWDLPNADPFVFCLEKELEINSRLSINDIQHLSEWAAQEGLPETRDVELVKFLHSCDYSLDNAKSCMKTFYSYRQESPELFICFNLDSPNIQAILDVIVLAVLPCRTPDNCRIIYNGLKTPLTNNYVFADVCRMMIMAIESIFLTEPTVKGVIYIHDLKLASMAHFLKFGFSLPKKLAKYTNFGMPIKLIESHIVNSSGFIDMALSMVHHVASKKDWEKVYVHQGDNLNTLLKKIPSHCLPRELGGCLPPVLELEAMTLQRFRSLDKKLKTKNG